MSVSGVGENHPVRRSGVHPSFVRRGAFFRPACSRRSGGGGEGVFEGDADLAGEAVGEALVVGADNDVHFWVLEKTPGGEAVGDQLGFAVTRRDEDHKAFTFAGRDAMELFVDQLLIGPVPGHVG